MGYHQKMQSIRQGATLQVEDVLDFDGRGLDDLN